nr:hypothetical protein [Tanacetum cinerariifolium]
MALTFADTHNMIAYLIKFDASEGFEQILDFLNGSVIQYALTVNPNIYVSCIKQFWSSILFKKVNDVIRLQALIDRRKVIITEDTVHQLFIWMMLKVLIIFPMRRYLHNWQGWGTRSLLQSLIMNMDSSLKFYMYPRFLQLMISAKVGDLTSHTTKYTSPALTQKQAADDVVDVVADDVADVVAHAAAEPTPPSPTPTTTPPPPQKLPSTSQEIREEEEVESFRIEKIKEGWNCSKDKVLSMQDDEPEPAELKEVIKVVTTAKLMTEVVTAAATTITAAPITATIIIAAPSAARRRKGVVIRDLEETATPSTIIHSEPKSKDKGKGILVEEPKPLKKKAQIEQDKAYAREKPQTKAQAKKNMMVYLKNMVGFKIDFFKGMSYDDIRPIFEKYFNSNVAFLEKSEKELEEEASMALKRKSESSEEKAAKKQKFNEEVEELKKHLQIVPNNEDDVYTEATPLALKVPVVDYQIHIENNKPYYKIIRVDGTHQLFLSFLSLLRNFDREDLVMLWQIVQERFASSKPKNFSDDFLLATLKAMFEKPDVEAQVWKNQRGIHGLVKVKSWKLLDSCGVHIITFTTTQIILLVERRYPLTRFTLDQMLNNVRLKDKEESKVSLELIRFVRRHQQEGYRPE